MTGHSVRLFVVGIGAVGLLAGTAMIWRSHQDAALIPQEAARRIDDGKDMAAPAVDRPESASRSAPAASPGGWLSDADYPAEAIRQGWQGTAAFALSIDANGMVSHCVVTATSGHSVLDRATCHCLQRSARFIPARDAAGRAVPDIYRGRISWRLPE